MTDSQPSEETPSNGFLTEEMMDYLTGSGVQDEDQVRNNLFCQLHAALDDLKAVSYFLDDDDVEQFFADENQFNIQNIREATEAIMTLLYCGGQVGNIDVTNQLKSGIIAAEATQGQRAEVEIDVRTSSMLTPGETVEQLEKGNRTAVSYEEMNRLLMADEINAERIAKVLKPDNTDQTVAELAESLRFERKRPDSTARHPTAAGIDTTFDDDPDNDSPENSTAPDKE